MPARSTAMVASRKRLAHLVEPQPVVLDVKLGVLPVPPLRRVDGKARGLALLRRHGRHQRVHRLDHGQRRRAFRLRRVEVGDDVSAGGDAAERLLEQTLPVGEQALRARALQPVLRMFARRRARDLGAGLRQEGTVVVAAHVKLRREGETLAVPSSRAAATSLPWSVLKSAPEFP
jgi:hypothetical protein